MSSAALRPGGSRNNYTLPSCLREEEECTNNATRTLTTLCHALVEGTTPIAAAHERKKPLGICFTCYVLRIEEECVKDEVRTAECCRFLLRKEKEERSEEC